MAEANGRATSGIAWALSSSRSYPASALLDALSKEGMPKPAILDVITAQKARYSVRELLNAAYAQEPTERAALFKIIAEIADESSIDDLVSRIEGKDPVARLHIIQVLGALQHPYRAASGAETAQGQQQAGALRRAVCPRAHGRPVRHAAHHRDAARRRKSKCRTRPWTWWSRPIIPTPSSSWSRCSRTRTNTRGVPLSKC